jgi:hypothetical protein
MLTLELCNLFYGNRAMEKDKLYSNFNLIQLEIHHTRRLDYMHSFYETGSKNCSIKNSRELYWFDHNTLQIWQEIQKKLPGM